MEPFVDTGRELMVPRRVAEGERLYRDIQFFHGPLAPYAGALLEKLGGGSFAARTALALALAVAAVEALRRLARTWLPGPGGAIAAALAVALPFFLRPGGWMWPFSVDTSIAIAALTGALHLLSDPDPKRSAAWRDARIAACLTAALLSRPELGLAGVAVAALELVRAPRRILFAAGAPVAISAGAYALLSAGIPFRRLVTDGWLAILGPPEAFQSVYRSYAGLDRPLLRAGELALASILLLLAACLLVVGAAAAQRLRASSPSGARLAALAPLLVIAIAAIMFQFPPASWGPTLALFPPVVRVVPAVCALAFAARAVAWATGRRARDWAPSVPAGALLLAALFGGRLFLAAGYAGPYNAFFLPLPILVACAVAARAADRWSSAFGAALPALVQGALAVLLVASVTGLAAAYRGPGWETLETRVGAVVLPAREARPAGLALADLERRVPRGGSLVGFPEAGFFNYVIGAREPLPVDQFWPGHLDPAGEDRIAARIAAEPPDAVVLVNAIAVGEGLRAFGEDYSRRLGAFLASSTRPVAAYGPGARVGEKIGDPQFFIEIRVPVARAGMRSSGRGSRP